MGSNYIPIKLKQKYRKQNMIKSSFVRISTADTANENDIGGFIQAILMSVRWHKKLTEFWNSIFIKSYFKAFWHWNYVQNTLICYLFVLQMQKDQNLWEVLPSEPQPRLRYESLAELTGPWEPHLHCTIFKTQS